DLGGGPNGAALGPDGAMYICNNGGRFQFNEVDGNLFPGPRPDTHRGGMIQRVDLETHAVSTVYDSCDGRALHAPNDIVFDREGGFWFTDYGTGNDDGAIFYALPGGTHITRWIDRLPAPNGIGLSPDGNALYVANTRPSM